MTDRVAAAPRSRLRGRAAPAKPGIADEVLARADAVIDRLSAEYPLHASRDLARLEQCAKLMAEESHARQPHYGEIYRIAHDIRGQGAVFGYPLVTRLAGSLCLATRSLEPHDGAIMTIINSHVAGLRALLEHRITDNKDHSALTIAAGLELLVRSRTTR